MLEVDATRVEQQRIPLVDLLATCYGIDGVTLLPLHVGASGNRGIYRLNHPCNPPYVLRASRHINASQWFSGPAAVLQLLAGYSYASPQIIPTCDGRIIAQRGEWTAYITSFIEGRTMGFTPEDLKGIGSALGKLHRIKYSPQAPVADKLMNSWWDPERLAKNALDQLAALERSIPSALTSLYRTLIDSLQWNTSFTDLPITIIHGDCRPGNAIATNHESILIDWDWAGLGIPLIDVANLLINCHLSEPERYSLQPYNDGINALIDGYCCYRRLESIELAELLPAIRFTIASSGVDHFVRALQVGAYQDVWVSKLKVRFVVADQIFSQAQIRFKRMSSASRDAGGED